MPKQTKNKSKRKIVSSNMASSSRLGKLKQLPLPVRLVLGIVAFIVLVGAGAFGYAKYVEKSNLAKAGSAVLPKYGYRLEEGKWKFIPGAGGLGGMKLAVCKTMDGNRVLVRGMGAADPVWPSELRGEDSVNLQVTIYSKGDSGNPGGVYQSSSTTNWTKSFFGTNTRFAMRQLHAPADGWVEVSSTDRFGWPGVYSKVTSKPVFLGFVPWC